MSTLQVDRRAIWRKRATNSLCSLMVEFDHFNNFSKFILNVNVRSSYPNFAIGATFLLFLSRSSPKSLDRGNSLQAYIVCHAMRKLTQYQSLHKESRVIESTSVRTTSHISPPPFTCINKRVLCFHYNKITFWNCRKVCLLHLTIKGLYVAF